MVSISLYYILYLNIKIKVTRDSENSLIIQAIIRFILKKYEIKYNNVRNNVNVNIILYF